MELGEHNRLDDPLYENDYEKQQINEITKLQIRLGFIRKVYGILSLQLGITTFFVMICFIDSVANFVLNSPWLYFLNLIIVFVVLLILACSRDIARRVPTNYILLMIWTVCFSYMIGVSTAMFTPATVIASAVMTFGIVLSLTVYAFNTEKDFTVYGGMLYVVLCLFVIIGFFTIFFGFFFNLIYCALGVLLFSLFLIIDTQMMMGKYGEYYEIDDYVIAAIEIYLDIINIFVFILRIFGQEKSN
jgi:FtsH-binding integral membrane protein